MSFRATPGTGVTTSLTSGPLGLEPNGRDGVLQIPAGVSRNTPVPLLIFLHGATQNGARMMTRIGPAAEHAGVAVLAPDSRGTTWDAIRGDFGEDIAFLNRALEHVYGRLAVDPARLAIGGFSDGASDYIVASRTTAHRERKNSSAAFHLTAPLPVVASTRRTPAATPDSE